VLLLIYIPLHCHLLTLSHLELQWGEPPLGAAFGTSVHVAWPSVIVAGPAASGGQPLVLTVYGQPPLKCQVEGVEIAMWGRMKVANLPVPPPST
jgi:hypothetical protein